MRNAYPKHIFDFLLWPIIALAWEPFSRKQSHWWHWRKYDLKKGLPLLTVEPDKSSKPRSGLWSAFWYTNLGWTDAVVLEPVDYTGAYRIGYQSRERRGLIIETCSVVLKGPTAVLVGPHQTNLFALAYPGDKPLILRQIKRVRKSGLDKDIFLA